MNALQNAINLGTAVSPSLSIEIIDPFKHAAYDEMVSARADSVPFHSRAWLSVVRDTYGHKPVCFVAKSGSDVLAMLPIVEVLSCITGRRGVMVPFADFCPPMARDIAVYDIVLAEAIKYGRERRWKYLEFRGGGGLLERARASVQYHAHSLDLSVGPDQIFGRFEGNLRRGIGKAEREGVRVEVSNSLEAMQIYYTLHCETRKKHGVPPQPFSFFQNLYHHFISKQLGIVAVAWYRSVPIAAAVFIHHGRNAVYKFSASNAAYVKLRGNNLVLWEAIRWYANQGLWSMHFGRTSFGNDGLRKYKSVWGTEETVLEYFRYSLSKQAYVVHQDRSEGGWNRLLGLLPSPLFRLVGQILYRHLS
jgi:hypothetical protein